MSGKETGKPNERERETYIPVRVHKGTKGAGRDCQDRLTGRAAKVIAHTGEVTGAGETEATVSRARTRERRSPLLGFSKGQREREKEGHRDPEAGERKREKRGLGFF